MYLINKTWCSLDSSPGCPKGEVPLYTLFTLAHHQDFNHHFLNRLICAATASPLSDWIIAKTSGRGTAGRTAGMESLRTAGLCLYPSNNDCRSVDAYLQVAPVLVAFTR